ncbi:MAG TPA: glycosyltransferase family 39 protein [Phycisphaerae bacterium]|nr:glycosyltransferase family 39 protein [Phycisphaerae bacterium]
MSLTNDPAPNGPRPEKPIGSAEVTNGELNNSRPAPSELGGTSASTTRGTHSTGVTKWFLLLVVGSLFVCMFDLSGGSVFEGTDCWVAQTAREMQQRGEWIMPYFSGEERLQKSPGPYWAVILASKIRGVPVDEVAARIPNSLSAVGLIIVIFWLTRRIAGNRAAIFAGFATASSGLILYWTGRGASDLGMTFFSTLALAALWVALADEPPGRRRNVFILLAYFSAGLCMLYKMPMPLVTVGIPAIGSLVLQNRWKALANPWHLVGLLLFFLPWAPWIYAVVEWRMHGDWGLALAKWRVEYIDRMTGELPNVEANKQWFFYLFYIGLAFVYVAPYTLSLPNAFTRAFKRDPSVNDDGRRFMAIWFLSLLLFFTLSTGKEARYFLPAMPPLFVLLGIELSWFFSQARPANTKGAWALAALFAVAIPIAAVYGGMNFAEKYVGSRGTFEWVALKTPYIGICIIAGVGLTLAAVCFARNRRNLSFAMIVATIWIGWFWSWSNLLPVFRAQRGDVSFSRQLRALVDANPGVDQHMYQVAQQNPTITWHSDVRFPRVIDQLVLLEKQNYHRDYDTEVRLVATEMLNKLRSDDLSLFVATREHYLLFLYKAPELARELGFEMPKTYLWIQSTEGPERHQTILFGNQPPPFETPVLDPPWDMAAYL